MSAKDQKRIQGPEKTFPYSAFQSPIKEFNQVRGKRKDGRSAFDVRPLFMSVGVISQAKGSSFIEIGNTKIVCGIYGPKDIQRGDFKLTGKVYCEVKFTPFSCPTRKSPQPDRQQKELSRQMKEALEATIILEKFPKSQIDVYLTVIEDGGSLLSGCLTAAGLALCHASIDVYDLLVGATLLWRRGVTHVDPTLKEEESLRTSQREEGVEGEGIMTMGMMPTYAGGQVALLVHEGELNVELLSDGTRIATETCNRIYALARQTLLNFVEEK